MLKSLPSAIAVLSDSSDGAGDTVRGLTGDGGTLGEAGEGVAGPLVAPPDKLGWMIMASCRRLRTSSAVARCRGVWFSYKI